MAATAGLQCGFGAPLGGVLDELRAIGMTIIRLDLQESTQEETTALTQEVLDAGLQPLCIIRRPEQMLVIPEGALIEVGNEPDLEHFGWTVEEYITVGTECVALALEHKRRIYLGVVSNLNPRGFNFLRKLPWDEWVGDGICCSIHRYPDGHSPQNPHQGSESREEEIAILRDIVGARPLACTEVGYHEAEWTQAEVANNMAWERQFFGAQGFELVSAYQLNDGPGSDPINTYGFRRMDGSWKPVAYAFANTTFPPLDGLLITIESDHGQFLAVGQDGVVVANRESAGAWETFQVTRVSDTEIALKSWQHLYLTAELDNTVHARARSIGPWETWTFEIVDDDRMVLTSSHGLYLTAELDGSVRARAEDIGPWEQWTSDPPNWWDHAAGNANMLHGAMTRDQRVLGDNTGPRIVMAAHFMEGFSAFCHDKSVNGLTVEGQLKIIATKYGAVRNLDVLGYFDSSRPGDRDEWVAWRGREVTPIPFVAYSGATIPATPDYWEKKRQYVTLLHELKLKIMDDRGDMNSWSRQQKLEHMFQNGRFYNSLPFGREVLLGLWSCNEAWQNGGNEQQLLIEMQDAFRDGAGWVPAICGLSAPGGASDPAALAACDPPMNWWESEMPDSFLYWSADPASVLTVHGNRGNHANIIEHYFGYAYDETMRDSGKVAFNTEPVGGGFGVSVGRVDDPELLCGLTTGALIGGQGWCWMSGNGVFWNGDLADMPGFAEVARLPSFLPNDIATWPYVFHAGTRFRGMRILAAVDPTRCEHAIADDGRFALVVHTLEQAGNALPCERDCREFTVINMVTGATERTGPLAAGQRYQHPGTARLIVGQLQPQAAQMSMPTWKDILARPKMRRAGRLSRLRRLLGERDWTA